MDDLLELVIRLLDPFVKILGPHAVAAFAILGGLITYRNNRKQRKRFYRLEAKVDFIIERLGLRWNAENNDWNGNMTLNSLQSSYATKSLVRSAMSFIAPAATAALTLSRRVMRMSKKWLVGLLGYIGYFVKMITGYEVPDEMIDIVAEIILLLIPLIAMFTNMKKGGDTNAEHQIDEGPAV